MTVSVRSRYRHSGARRPAFSASILGRSTPVQESVPKSPKQAEVGGGTACSEISFGPFKLYPEERLLLEADKAVHIGSRALDILIAIVENPSQLVSKEDLMAKVWPNLHVEPANLTVHIAALRRILGDGRNGNRYLVNIPGRGYRFVATVAKAEQFASAQVVDRSRANNLPAQVTRLVGRADTLIVVTAHLLEERLVTIVGPGGIGKSSLALAVAEQACGMFAHGAWHIDLAPLSDASSVPNAIMSALGLVTSGGNASLVEQLRGKQMLLFLDNCEHVVQAAASTAVAILRGVPGIRILSTSREPLRAEGEHRHRLTALALPQGSRLLTSAEALRFAAVDLFVQSVTAKLQNFVLKESDVASVVDLCRKLDGIPLAIEFAANLIDTFGIRGLAERVQNDLQTLGGGYRTAVPRHQTLRSMLDWSYDWLPEKERLILRRISVLDGEFTLEHAFAAATNDDLEVSDVADGIASLVTKSLVSADIAGKEPQYRLLETTRAYAFEKLQGSRKCDLLERLQDKELPDPLDQAQVG
jgi:predicted ATPase/DNA-binding winged helix-turn-helix (wHTH) protein